MTVLRGRRLAGGRMHGGSEGVDVQKVRDLLMVADIRIPL